MTPDGGTDQARRRDRAPADIQALVTCRAEGRDFNTLFRRQYVLTREAGRCPAGWREVELDGWHLCYCPDLPVTPIQDAAGQIAGFFIGIGVDAGGAVFDAAPNLPEAAGSGGFWRAAEAVIEGIAGRYLALVSDGVRQRFYTDPTCEMSLVYDPVCRVAASSLLLCLHRPMAWNRRMNHRGVLRGVHNFALQHTSDRYVKRAMANHYLDLENFCMIRHFPRGDEVLDCGEGGLRPVCEAIVERLRGIMTALLGTYSCAMPLTGGNDARNLMACCTAEQLQGVRLFTHHVNKMSGFDCMIARQLGDMAGVPVEIIDTHAKAHARMFDKAQIGQVQQDRAIASGYQTRGRDARTLVAEQLAPEADLLLRGNVMEVMRANQYRPRRPEFSLAHGLARLRVAHEIDAVQEAIWGPEYMMWADTLPQNARNRVHDFQFTELLLPNTMGGGLTVMGPQFYMNPFNDRGMIMRAMALPPEIRRTNRMNEILVDIAWPELNTVERIQAFKSNPDNHRRYDSEFRPGRAARIR